MIGCFLFPSLSPSQYRGVLFDIIRGSASTSNLLTKNQCVDYYSTDIETRRFYQLDTSMEGVVRNLNPGNCVNYMVSPDDLYHVYLQCR